MIKAADRCSKISNADLEAALASLRASTTESKAVAIEYPLLKPDWLLSSRLFCVKKAETWLNTTRSSVFAMKGRRETGNKRVQNRHTHTQLHTLTDSHTQHTIYTHKLTGVSVTILQN